MSFVMMIWERMWILPCEWIRCLRVANIDGAGEEGQGMVLRVPGCQMGAAVVFNEETEWKLFTVFLCCWWSCLSQGRVRENNKTTTTSDCCRDSSLAWTCVWDATSATNYSSDMWCVPGILIKMTSLQFSDESYSLWFFTGGGSVNMNRKWHGHISLNALRR